MKTSLSTARLLLPAFPIGSRRNSSPFSRHLSPTSKPSPAATPGPSTKASTRGATGPSKRDPRTWRNGSARTGRPAAACSAAGELLDRVPPANTPSPPRANSSPAAIGWRARYAGPRVRRFNSQWPTAGARSPGRRPFPLSPEWREHAVEFQIEAPAQDETWRRFILPKGATGEFARTDPCRRELAAPPIQPKRQTPPAARDPATALTLRAATPTENLSPG